MPSRSMATSATLDLSAEVGDSITLTEEVCGGAEGAGTMLEDERDEEGQPK